MEISKYKTIVALFFILIQQLIVTIELIIYDGMAINQLNKFNLGLLCNAIL